MATHGYDAAEIATGSGLLTTAADAFGVRLTGLGGKSDETRRAADRGRKPPAMITLLSA